MDELDLLIDNALGDTDASDPEPDETETPTEEEATEPVAVEETVEESDEDPAGEPDDESDVEEPDEDPEGTLTTETEGSATLSVPEDYETIRRKAAFQERILNQLATAQQRKREQDEAAAAEADRNAKIQALKEKWDEMDPADAYREQLAFVAGEAETTIGTLQQQLTQLQQERAQQQELREEAEAKAAVIPMILQKYGLKDDDRDIFEEINNPVSMEKVAEKLATRRKAQTAKAREVKAEKAKTNPALKVTTPGAAAASQKPDFNDVDDMLDWMFGS